MRAVLIAAAIYLSFSALAIAALLRATRGETLAELPDEPVPDEPASHDPAACEVCCWASDVGVIAAIDWALWSSQMQERAS